MLRTKNMNTQIINHANITTKGDSPMDIKELKTAISKNPVRLGLVFFGIVAIGAIIYYATAAPTYKCVTKAVGGFSFCYKIKVSPLPQQNLGIVANTACPNKPPSNCP